MSNINSNRVVNLALPYFYSFGKILAAGGGLPEVFFDWYDTLKLIGDAAINVALATLAAGARYGRADLWGERLIAIAHRGDTVALVFMSDDPDSYPIEVAVYRSGFTAGPVALLGYCFQHGQCRCFYQDNASLDNDTMHDLQGEIVRQLCRARARGFTSIA